MRFSFLKISLDSSEYLKRYKSILAQFFKNWLKEEINFKRVSKKEIVF
jgi:hypothetical protein